MRSIVPLTAVGTRRRRRVRRWAAISKERPVRLLEGRAGKHDAAPAGSSSQLGVEHLVEAQQPGRAIRIRQGLAAAHLEHILARVVVVGVHEPPAHVDAHHCANLTTDGHTDCNNSYIFQ